MSLEKIQIDNHPLEHMDLSNIIGHKKFLDTYQFLQERTPEERCLLGEYFNINKVFKRQAGYDKSKYMSAYELSNSNNNLIFVAKLVSNTNHNRQEINWYYYFVQTVLLNESPHFPLVYHHQECDLCDSRDRAKPQNCLLFFSEKATDNSTEIRGVEELSSMFFQVLMALYLLEKIGITHNDLNLGNILYHSQPEHKNKYINYKVNDKDIYVKHFGKLFILWDFEFMGITGQVDPRDNTEILSSTYKVDLARLIMNIKNISLKTEIQELYNKHNTISDFIDHIIDRTDFFKSQSTEDLINDIPYIF